MKRTFQYKRSPRQKRYDNLPLWLCFVFLSAAFACGITLLALWCQPNDLPDIWALFLEKPVRFALNLAPAGLLLLFFAFLSGNLFLGAAAADFLVCGFAIANRVKIQVRDEPVFPRDLALLKEAGSALEKYEIRLPMPQLAAVLASAGILLLLGILAGRGRVPPLRTWAGRLAGAAVSLAVLIVLTFTAFRSESLYDSLGSSNPYRLSVVFNENGFPYCFFHQMTQYQVDRPAGYSRARARAWDEGERDYREDTGGGTGGAGVGNHTGIDDSAGTGKKVNVILVMNEAFSDITDDPVFAFSPENDPLKNLHAVQEDPHGIALRLVVPGFAGGTANTEFDVFTGMQTNALGTGTTSAMRTVNRNLDSLFRLFRDDGYHTSFFHPGDDWFYNRENVYRWLGAEETVFIDQMEDPEYKGRWVTDAYMAGLITDELDRSAAMGKPLFHAATTIQNHMAYYWNKYGEGYSFPLVPLNRTVTDDVDIMIRVYVEGVRDADAMLGSLRANFAARSEPVLLVYYGDHLPYLGDEQMVYRALGMDMALPDGERANPFSIYETPCVLWANDAAAAELDWENAVSALGLAENQKLSAAFLGPLLLELTGRGQMTPWASFLNDLRRLAPVVQRQVWQKPEGTVVEGIDGTELENWVRVWRQWSYYKLEQKTIR